MLTDNGFDAQRLGARLWPIVLALSIIELAAAAWTFVYGPFSFSILGLGIRSNDGLKALAIGVWGVTASAWVHDSPWLQNRVSASVRPACALWVRRAAGPGLLVLLGLLALPIVQPGFLDGHDATAHLTYSYLFDRALTEGQFPVRWTQSVVVSNGQPLFNYYQVGFYYLIEVIKAFVGSLTASFKAAIVLVWSAGTLFSFGLLRRHGFFAAASAAAVFASSTYLLLDVYVRAAFPEFVAICAGVGILWTTNELTARPRWDLAGAHALLLGLLLISHLPAALILSPVLAGFCLLRLRTVSWDRRCIAVIAAGTLLGVAMAAFYVFPAIGELRFVKAEGLISKSMDFHQHFLEPAQWFDTSWGTGPLDGPPGSRMSVQIAPIQWLAAAAAFIALARRRERSMTLFWLCVLLGGAFMTTGASIPVWHSVPPLAFAQFPWRFLMLPMLASMVLIGIAVSKIRHEATRALAFVAVLMFQVYITNDYRALTEMAYRYDVNLDTPGWWVGALPTGMSAAFREPAYDPVERDDVVPFSSSRWTVVDGTADVRVRVSDDARTLASVTASDASIIRLMIPVFPGWRVYLDGTEQTFQKTARGYLAVQVPPGRHLVEARLTNTPLRTAGNLISLGAFMSWALGLGVIGYRRVSKRRWRSIGSVRVRAGRNQADGDALDRQV